MENLEENDEIVKNSFNEINLEQFIESIKNNNNEVYLQILCFLYEQIPFTSKNIDWIRKKYYKKKNSIQIIIFKSKTLSSSKENNPSIKNDLIGNKEIKKKE